MDACVIMARSLVHWIPDQCHIVSHWWVASLVLHFIVMTLLMSWICWDSSVHDEVYRGTELLQWNSNEMAYMSCRLIWSRCKCNSGSVACSLDPNMQHFGRHVIVLSLGMSLCNVYHHVL